MSKDDRRWTLEDEWVHPGWVIRAVGPDLKSGEGVEVVPAARLAEVEAALQGIVKLLDPIPDGDYASPVSEAKRIAHEAIEGKT